MRMAVDESGDHAGARAADPFVGIGGVCAPADPGDLGTVDDQRRIRDDAERVAVAVRRVVGDELTDIGVEHGHRVASIAASIRSVMADGEFSFHIRHGDMLAVDHHAAPVDDDIGDIGCGRGENDILDGRTTARGANRIHPHCNEVRSCARHEFAGVGPAECAVAVAGRGPQQAVGGDDAACAGGEAFVEFDRAGLFEQIDHGVAVGAEAEQSASRE